MRSAAPGVSPTHCVGGANQFWTKALKRALAVVSLTAAVFAPALPIAHAAETDKSKQPAYRISDGVVKIGVITDMSSLYKDLAGAGSVLAARMAIEDFGGNVAGSPIELVDADTRNEAEQAGRIARDWFEGGKVDMVIDVPNTAAALEVIKAAKASNKIAIISAGGSARITNEDCTEISVHWTYDTSALANVAAKAIVKRGGDTWYFVTADYAFGHSLEKDATEVIKANGGAVLGTVRHPFPSSVYASLKVQAAGLLQAQASNAKVIALASAGTDATNAIKQARQFGITPKQTLAALLLFDTDVHTLGLQDAQDLFLASGFYWDLNDDTRKWSRRFFERHKRMPTMAQAGVYSAVTHYLKSVAAARTDATKDVMEKIKSLPVNDFFAKNGSVRADGRMVHDMYLLQVKKPGESKYPWDYMHVRAVVPGDQAFTPLSASKCSLVSGPAK
jgi:branched-chain amino acid transport system substrate-binding protein